MGDYITTSETVFVTAMRKKEKSLRFFSKIPSFLLSSFKINAIVYQVQDVFFHFELNVLFHQDVSWDTLSLLQASQNGSVRQVSEAHKTHN